MNKENKDYEYIYNGKIYKCPEGVVWVEKTDLQTIVNFLSGKTATRKQIINYIKTYILTTLK